MTFDTILNPSQHDFVTNHLEKNSSKFTFLTGGYKTGKTFAFIEKAIALLVYTKQDGLLAEPTYTLNERLIKPALEARLKYYKIPFKYIGGTKNWYETSFGKIILATQEKKITLEGHNLGWFGFDEMDSMARDKASDNWRVIISKLTLGTKQFGFAVGTNEGFQFAYEKWYKNAEMIFQKQYTAKIGIDYSRKIFVKGKYKLFMGSTCENEDNLPEDHIQTLIEDYDAKLLLRYLHGEFVNITQGQIYYNFSKKNVVNVEFDPNRETAMSWDVNFSDSPMCTSLIQEFNPSEIYDEIPSYINENETVFVTTKHFANVNTNTDAQCQEIYEYLERIGFNAKLEIYGDYSGIKREASSSKSHYEIVSNWFQKYGVGTRYTFKIKPTASLFDRVATMNKMLRDSAGFRRHLVSSGNPIYKEDIGLTMLIEDFEQVVWSKTQNQMDKTRTGRTDPTDADSYFFYYNFNLAVKKPVFF